jgi:hypothetical protein
MAARPRPAPPCLTRLDQYPMERAAWVTDRSFEARGCIPSESGQLVQKGPAVAPGNRRPASIRLRYRPKRGLVQPSRPTESVLTVTPIRSVPGQPCRPDAFRPTDAGVRGSRRSTSVVVCNGHRIQRRSNNRMNPTKPAMASGARASRVIRVFDRPERKWRREEGSDVS